MQHHPQGNRDKKQKKEILISCIWGLSVTNANKKKSQKSMIHAILEGSLKSLASWGGSSLLWGEVQIGFLAILFGGLCFKGKG